MKRWMKWTIAMVAIALLAGGALRAVSARKAKTAALDAQQAAQKVQSVVEVTPNDLLQVKALELSQGLPLSGALKAVNSAFVKARVAGELQGLALREGDFVKAGQVLARIDSTEFQARLLQARQQAESAKAQIDIAQRSYDNNRSLVDQGFISKTALESSIATLAAAQANYRAAQAGADIAGKALDDTVLRAPIAGQIAQRLAQPGERVSVDTRIVEIVDLRQLELEASLSGPDSIGVKVGQVAKLTIDGAPRTLSAKVVRVNPSALAGSRAVLAYLALDSSDGLRQGLFAQGTLVTGAIQVLAVPVSAVRTDKPEPYVQLLADGVVRHQSVQLGARGDFNGQAMVGIEGLPPDATILTGAIGTLRAGTAVKLAAGVK